MPPTPPGANPYVGPRTFSRQEADRFFGREREARELFSLVMANRLVLFYSQSGAGKSSLLNTRLIPQLKAARRAVLPVGRVGGEIPAGVGAVDNIFVFNLLLKLDQSGGDPARFAHMSLSQFLAGLTSLDGEHYYYEAGPVEEASTEEDGYEQPVHVLIIDQFEEIITTHAERWPDREAFFRQLHQAMQDDPLLSVVLTLREDYVAALDPYIPLLANRLRTRFYMQRMDYDAALQAVQQPAAQYHRPFAPGAAEQLVNNLRQIRVPGQERTQAGQYLEPVQVQVLCYQLWNSLQDRPGPAITAQDVAGSADVEVVLGDFYTQTLAAVVAETGVSEARLRTWFETQLITAAGTRGMAYQGTADTAGMPNQVVKALADRFLLRAEIRSGGTWYELVHDRFVDPILQANKAWWDKQDPLLRAARAWQDADRDKSKLYLGVQLREALASLPGQPEPTVTAFLHACQEEEERQQAQEELRRREEESNQKLLAEQQQRIREQTAAAAKMRTLLWLVAGFAIVAGLLAVLTGWFLQQAKRQEGRAIQASELSLALQLAAQSASLANKRLPDALLLGVAATRQPSLYEVRNNFFTVLSQLPRGLRGFAWAHSDKVHSVAFSPDGKTLTTGTDDGRVTLWDVASRTPQGAPLKAPEMQLFSVAFSPDGTTLAAGGWYYVTLWDVASRTPLGEPLKGHTDYVSGLAFSPDGKTLATCSRDETVILWDVTTRKSLGEPIKVQGAAIPNLAFSPDGTILAISGWDGVIRLWDVASRRPLDRPLRGGDVRSVAFSPDGKTLATAHRDGTAMLWDVASRTSLGAPLTGHTDFVFSVAFSPDGTTLATGSADRTVILWDVASRTPLGAPLTGYMNAVHSVAFNPDGRTLAAGGNDNTILLWNIVSRRPQGEPVTGHKQEVWDLAFSPDLKTVALPSGPGGTVVLLDVASGRPLGEPLQGVSAVWGVAFSRDGKTLAAGSRNGAVILWDVAAHALRGELLTGHSGRVIHLAFSPDGTMLATCSDDHTVILWNVATRKPQGEPLNMGNVWNLAFSPDGMTLATGGRDESGDGIVVLWDVASHSPRGEPLKGHQTRVASLAFSPDGKTLATGSDDKTVILWDVARSTPLGEPLKGHSDVVWSLVFSPDGQTLATASGDRTVMLWDVASRKPLGEPLRGHKNGVMSLAYSRDGQTLATGDMDGTIMVWDVGMDVKAWETRACAIVNRNFTHSEWRNYMGERPYHKVCPQHPGPDDPDWPLK